MSGARSGVGGAAAPVFPALSPPWGGGYNARSFICGGALVDAGTTTPLAELKPPGYLESLAALLESTACEAWRLSASELAGAEYAERVRLEILKSLRRIEREDALRLYLAAEQAAARLNVPAGATLYQVQQTQSAGLSASLFFIPGEIHIALGGPALDGLDDDELCALVGRELGRFLLLDGWGRRYSVCEQVMDALVHEPEPCPVCAHSRRLARLCTEVFCDRAALAACGGNLKAAVGTLLKLEPGAADTPVDASLHQAREAFARENAGNEGSDRPEVLVRVQALQLWSEAGTDAAAGIDAMLAGPFSLERMHLPDQQAMAGITRDLIDTLLAEQWMRSPRVMAHARRFFDDYTPPGAPPDPACIAARLRRGDDMLRKYLSHVLLDFAACDREIQEPALAAAILTARSLGIEAQFVAAAVQELDLGKRRIERLQAQAEAVCDVARKRPEAPA